MIHEIINQYGNHIISEHIRDEINHALEHGMTYTYFEGSKIEIEEDFKKANIRTTLVNVTIRGRDV